MANGANKIYPLWKQEMWKATANCALNSGEGATGVYCALIDEGNYTYLDTHQFYNTGISTAGVIVGTPMEILTKTMVNGTFDGDDLTFTAVVGASVEALIFYRANAGANTTWPLISFIDQGVTGFPVTPNGGNITVTFAGDGIFTPSDRALKENVREVGALGALPIYEYSYKGEDRMRLGFMADEVLAVVPEAVATFGRFKAVNYKRTCEVLMT